MDTMPSLPRPWILIIDDELEIAEELAELCETSGFPAIHANNLDPALVLLRANPTIRVIASDLRMPNQETGALMRALNAASSQVGHPCLVMVLTGHAGTSEHEVATALGIQHFFPKPIDTVAFLATLTLVAEADRQGAVVTSE